ncbi:MAG: ORF6N domain-containing protein, partial [Niameybacter sp.]
VMLDFDLAQMYEVETRALKQAVRRNQERFPDDFMFTLSKEEHNALKISMTSQNVISNVGGTTYMPFAFTEQGVSMLSSVLKSSTAIKVNISIIRAFVAMREYITNTNLQSAEIRELRAKIEALEMNDEETLGAVNDLSEDIRKDIDNIYNAIAELSIKLPILSEPRRPLGYNIPREDKM